MLCSPAPSSVRVELGSSCRSRASTTKKCTKKRDARAKLLFCQSKPIAFLPFSLPSTSSLLKLPIVVIQKFCYHGNVTLHFSSLLLSNLGFLTKWSRDIPRELLTQYLYFETLRTMNSLWVPNFDSAPSSMPKL